MRQRNVLRPSGPAFVPVPESGHTFVSAAPLARAALAPNTHRQSWQLTTAGPGRELPH